MRNVVFFIILLTNGFALIETLNAATLQVSTGIQSSRFLDSVNLSDDEPLVSLAVDWTSDNGGYLGGNCSTSTVSNADSIKSSCDFYAGYFKPLSSNNAVSVQFTRHEYSRGLGGIWDFHDLAANWHINKKTTFSAIYSKNWLNRSFDSLALKGATQISVSEHINLNLSATLMALESDEAVDNLAFGKASFSYSLGRWIAEAGVALSDRDQALVLPFDVDDAEFSISFTYRLY